MSLNGGATQALDDAITASIAKGFTYVVAAGNANWDACTFSPSRVAGAITVAASDNLDQSAWFTNWGTCVDIYAPGVNITSAWNTADNVVNTISGTSMASPHVAGAVALYLESNRTATPDVISSALTANGTQNKLQYVYFGTPNVLLYTESANSGGCDGTLMQGVVSKVGELSYQSSTDGFAGGKGVYSGILSTPAGTQFGLALEQKKGMKWNQVAGTTTPNTKVIYNGNNGVYRWRVTGLVGTGSYGLCSVAP
jgi:subtilisin family serine protease